MIDSAERIDAPPPAPSDDDGGYPPYDGEPPAGGDGGEPEKIDWDRLKLCAAESDTDIGNSRRLRHRYGHELIHVQQIGWHVYDGRRWKEDVDEVGTRPLCHKTAELIALEPLVFECPPDLAQMIEAGDAAAVEYAPLDKNTRDPDIVARRQALREVIDAGKAARSMFSAMKSARRKYAKSSSNSGKLDNMLREALPSLSIALSALDTDPLALNVENGTLRFFGVPDPECPDPDTVRLKWRVRLDPHKREDMIAKLAAVEYDPEADAPEFRKFLERIIPAEPVRQYVQRYLGYGMTALTSEQVFVILHGEGANGKSTLVDLVARLLGDYATTVPISTLVGEDRRKGAEATPDLARLPGARFVRAAEPKEGVGFDESLIKQLTSGEPILVRRLHADFVEIYPTFKLAVSANRKPVIKGNDDGIWRRVNLVPFEVQIPEGERDKQLPGRLWANERAGIFNWLIEGLLDYLDRGRLDPPDVVQAATQEYRDESDLVGSFARAALEVTREPKDTVESGVLYAAYLRFCKRQAIMPIGQTTFHRRMPKTAAQLGFEKGKSSVVVYSGVRVRPEFASSPADEGSNWEPVGPSDTPL